MRSHHRAFDVSLSGASGIITLLLTSVNRFSCHFAHIFIKLVFSDLKSRCIRTRREVTGDDASCPAGAALICCLRRSHPRLYPVLVAQGSS